MSSASRTFRMQRAPRTIFRRSPRRSLATWAIGHRQSFRVSARRADKRLPFTSPEIEREVGGLIKEAKGWRVDLG